MRKLTTDIFKERSAIKHNNFYNYDLAEYINQRTQLVLARDNNQYQLCGSSEDLHCHHITGVEINPVESADIDNCITLCKECHGKVHSSGQCDVKRRPCIV